MEILVPRGRIAESIDYCCPLWHILAQLLFVKQIKPLTLNMSGTKIWLRAETKPAEARSARKFFSSPLPRSIATAIAARILIMEDFILTRGDIL